MRKRHIGLCALTLLLVALTAGVAFSAQFNFTPGLIVSEEYTDNLFLDSTNEEEDFITTVGVSLDGEILWRTAGVRLTYAPSYSFHNDNDDQDNWRHLVDLVSYKELTRYTRIDLTNSYLQTFVPNDQSTAFGVDENPLAQPLIQGDRNRRGLREYYSNATNLTLTHDFGANDSVYVGARYSIFRETDDPAPGEVSAESDILEPMAGITYWFTNNWGGDLDLVYSDRDFKERNDREQYDARAQLNRRFTRHFTGFVAYRHTYLDYDDDTLDSDVEIYQPTLGFTYIIDQNTTVTVGAGYYFQDFDDSTIDDEDGPILDAEIFKGIPFRRGRIDLIGRSGYTINDEGVDDLGLNIYYEGEVIASYSFTQSFTGSLSSLYRYDEFPDEEPERTDNTIRGSAGLSYQALSWMNLALTYSYTDVSSDEELDEYTENSVLFTITMTPANPIRLN